MIEMDWAHVRMCGIVHEHKPLDNVALDGIGQVVNGIGAVCQAEVDDRCRLCTLALRRSRKIRGMKIVVRPERRKRGKQGRAAHEKVQAIRRLTAAYHAQRDSSASAGRAAR